MKPQLFSLILLTFVSAASASASEPSALESIVRECYSGAPLKGRGERLKTLNGGRLSGAEAVNLEWIKECVVPFLPGEASARRQLAARVAWWSLREGVLQKSGASLFAYSNCHESGRDRLRTREPLRDCGTNIWQAGIAAGQVMNYSSGFYGERTRATIAELGPQVSEAQLLAWTATLAGYPAGTKTHAAIVASSGRVRKSWLMRTPLIGFQVVVAQEVVRECYQQKKRWCFAGKFRTAKLFGNSSATMRRVVGELETYFAR